MPRKKGRQIRCTISKETYSKVEKRVEDGDFGDIPDYLRSLVREDLKKNYKEVDKK